MGRYLLSWEQLPMCLKVCLVVDPPPVSAVEVCEWSGLDVDLGGKDQPGVCRYFTRTYRRALAATWGRHCCTSTFAFHCCCTSGVGNLWLLYTYRPNSKGRYPQHIHSRLKRSAKPTVKSSLPSGTNLLCNRCLLIDPPDVTASCE